MLISSLVCIAYLQERYIMTASSVVVTSVDFLSKNWQVDLSLVDVD